MELLRGRGVELQEKNNMDIIKQKKNITTVILRIPKDWKTEE